MSEYLQTLHRAASVRRGKYFRAPEAPHAAYSRPVQNTPAAELLPKVEIKIDRRVQWGDPKRKSRFVPGLTVQQIIHLVSRAFGDVTAEQIRCQSKAPRVVSARHLSMYLARELLAARSFPELGRQFGGMHHTSVLHGCRKIADALNSDIRLIARHARLRSELRSYREVA